MQCTALACWLCCPIVATHTKIVSFSEHTKYFYLADPRSCEYVASRAKQPPYSGCSKICTRNAVPSPAHALTGFSPLLRAYPTCSSYCSFVSFIVLYLSVSELGGLPRSTS